jgi:hypothetical protein
LAANQKRPSASNSSAATKNPSAQNETPGRPQFNRRLVVDQIPKQGDSVEEMTTVLFLPIPLYLRHFSRVTGKLHRSAMVDNAGKSCVILVTKRRDAKLLTSPALRTK